MKTKIITMFIITICSIVLASCQKNGVQPSASVLTYVDGNTVISLTDLDNGRTINIFDFEKLKVTLGSPAAGYQFDLPQYDSSILNLSTTSQGDPTGTGSFDINTWNFTFFKPGTTTLVMNAANTTDTTKVFEVTIVVAGTSGGETF